MLMEGSLAQTTSWQRGGAVLACWHDDKSAAGRMMVLAHWHNEESAVGWTKMDEMGFVFRGGRWMPTMMTMIDRWHA